MRLGFILRDLKPTTPWNITSIWLEIVNRDRPRDHLIQLHIGCREGSRCTLHHVFVFDLWSFLYPGATR